ncbi:hypothetical protein F4810DRAFT_709018 [Camillea tinctor]|nr:hypothetical protein F4810DRAFT_709018 [Camillea tinctor]
MRLRLVVRRNGLPEARLMWNVHLENNPTIANLLEQLNEDVPLEGGQWGLEDYVVELHDSDGTSFECLHYQPVRNVLNTDDRVFVRALDKDDSRRRRISGRYQISSDGRRLIDGVPFGRHRLRTSNGRPPIYIPPRKRRRLTREDEDNDDDDTAMLLLTDRATAQQDSPRVRFDTGSEDANSEDGEYEGDDQPLDETTSNQSLPDEDMSSDQSESEDNMDSPGEADLAQELRELEEENADFDKGEEQSDNPLENQTLDLAALDKLAALQAAFPSAPVDVCEKILMACAGDLKATYRHLVDGFAPKLSESALIAWPKVDEPPKSNALPDQVSSSLQPRSKRLDSSTKDAGTCDEAEDEESGNDPVPAFVLQYDYRGLPPGSITSGKGLAEMAVIAAREQDNDLNNKGAPASATANGIKSSSKEVAEESDDTTSSSGTSSSSESEESEDDSGGDDSDGDDDASSSDSSSDSDSDSDSDSESDSDSDSDSNNHHNPENGLGESESEAHDSSDSNSDSNEGSHASDSGPEEVSIGKSQANIGNRLLSSQDRAKSSDADSGDEDSESSSSSSESTSSDDEPSLVRVSKNAPLATSVELQSSFNIEGQFNTAEQSINSRTQPMPTATVPPGAGKESTKSRNARRRVAKRAKRLAQEPAIANSITTNIRDEEASAREMVKKESDLFEAKRRALLEAIANGGIEVGLESRIEPSDNTSKVASKRKREIQPDLECQDQSELHNGTPKETSPDESVSIASAQKRRRVDLGAGRRLVFGALGLRNPKSKKDEDQIRGKLMEDVRPIVNARLAQESTAAELSEQIDPPVQEDPGLWRTKINYRAVECCQEGIDLSEPPFPFVQRWDTQQQGFWSSKKNKRGGRNKRAQRNQATYYEDDIGPSKRKHNESGGWEGEGYDVTFNGIEDTHNTDDILLNYDDEDPKDPEVNEHAENSDHDMELEDLPIVPSDVTVLPTLRSGEARVGMVITWQKWSCSSATNWQPQVSNVSAVVVDVKANGTELEVCLAKRDRYLDGNQKQYDPYTGQRLYDRFEAPDLDEDDDDAEQDDEGYLTLSFSEMQDPRVLQQPLDAMGDTEMPQSAQNTEALQEGHDHQSLIPSPKPGEKNVARAADGDPASPTRLSGERAVSVNGPESGATSSTTFHQPGQGQQSVNPPVSEFSDFESPSRQLHETASEAISALSQDHYTIEVARTGSDPDGEQRDSEQYIPDPGNASANRSSLANFDIEDENDVIIGTPKVIHHRLAAPSVTSSVQSGRQPDYDTGVNDEPASFQVTEDGISTVLGENRSSIGPEDMTTQIPTSAPGARTPNKKTEDNKDPAINSSPRNLSTPDSLCSLNSVWCTAVTSRKTQSPSKSQVQAFSIEPSQPSRAMRNLAYEDAMRKLDELSDDAQESLNEPAMESSDSKDPEWIGEDGSSNDEREVVIKSSPHSPRPFMTAKISPPPRRRRSARQSTQFSLPQGAQVLELSSDSDSVILESYPDDEVDGTYSPKSDGLPKGQGWVKKKKGMSLSQPRGSTVPSGSQPLPRTGRRYLSASQGQVSSSVPVNLVSSIRQKSRKKLSARF